MRLSQYINDDVNIIDVMMVLEMIENCHKVDQINEGVLDSISSMYKNIKDMVMKRSDIIKNVEVEKGLISYLKSIGLGGSQMIYHAFNAYFNKSQESREQIKVLSQSVKKEYIVDILMKLDVLTLHLVTGPLHIIEAVTGWNILHVLKMKVEPVTKKAKEAIHTLETLKDSLEGETKKQLQKYANAIRRIFELDGYKKVSEETVTGDIAEPDTLIGDDPMRRRKKLKKKKKLCLKDVIDCDDTGKTA